ncbi:VPLPA-CTERM sorting domain-containing protein [Thetidibacter halocola]|uniref:VPLPA-CTERM sorting domain-containing protein n=1 Tax=Thetidibacter halocola TaxID=2827239 RepID=A0A8J7WFY7_9RHOB|nr:VPLPA-CTERM sorting domain-containing protein [Thetidibacter halocola]MBS0124613.1 VPLPA-CTERM sorting domain-containing protein [Thetidibacter halocola]
MMKHFLLTAAFVLSGLGAAHASTVRLDGVGDLGPEIPLNDGSGLWLDVEDGFSFLTCDYYCGDWGDDVITVAATNSTRQSEIKSVSGLRFDLISADLSAYSRYYRSGPTASPDPDNWVEYWNWAYHESLTYLNLAVFGYREGAVVASHEMSLESAAQLRFQPTFRNLDSVAFVSRIPDAPVLFWGPTDPNQQYCDRYSSNYACSMVRIDEVTLRVRDGDLTPIPLPAGLPLALTSLGLLMAVGKRRRKDAA